MPAIHSRRIPSVVNSTFLAQREELMRLIQRAGTTPTKNLYNRLAAELERELRRLVRAHRKDTMQAHQMRLLLAQVRAAQLEMSKSLSSNLANATRTIQQQALRNLTKDVKKLEQHFRGAEITLPIEESARLQGLIDKRRTSLLQMHKGSIARYTANKIVKMEDQLSLSLAMGETPDKAIDRIMDVSDTQWHQAERIVRTESAFAYNASHADGINETAKELPDMMMRWTEHVDDRTGRPLDNRVAVDSIAMHGQLAKSGGAFYMPPSAPVADAEGNRIVPRSLVGKSWTHPPNRPNDRSVIQPWRPHWKIPGWIWKGGKRVRVRA